MGERTAISWTDATWNPWQGCHKVSLGCRRCYMFREKEQYGQDPDVVVRSHPRTFKLPLRLERALVQRVFTCSWSDFFIEEADPWRNEAWSIIARTPWLTYQILTKRPERMAGRLPWSTAPWPNVWLLVSVENQKTADERIPILLSTPAAVRGVSYEPMLGPVDFWGPRYLYGVGVGSAFSWGQGIRWIIAGGESGPEHTVLEIGWLRSVFENTRAVGVPLFVKQDSGSKPGLQGRIPDELWVHEFPERR